MLILPSLPYFFFRWSLFGFGFWECLMRRRIGRIGSKWGFYGRSCASGFSWTGCTVLCPLELATVFGLSCTGAVKYVALPLVFGRGMLPSVVV